MLEEEGGKEAAEAFGFELQGMARGGQFNAIETRLHLFPLSPSRSSHIVLITTPTTKVSWVGFHPKQLANIPNL